MVLNGLLRGSERYSFLNSRPVVRTVDWHGLQISVEFDKGQTKKGIGAYGEVWENTYKYPYGEIPDSRTLADGEGVDVYLGDDKKAEFVYVVHQLKRNGKFDEDKVMLDFPDEKSAIKAYKQHGPKWGFRAGNLDTMTVENFLNGYLASNRRL